MNLDLNLINLIILFGAVQGLIFSIILFFNKKHPGATFLGIFMFVLAFNGFETFSWSSGLDNYIVFFDLFGYVTIFAIGPSIYLYVESLLYPEKRRSFKSTLFHYIPPFFQLTACMVMTGLYFSYQYGFFDNVQLLQMFYGNYGDYAEPLSVLAFITYLLLSWLLFGKGNEQQMKLYISKEGQRTISRWIKTLLIILSVLAVIWPLTVLAPVLVELPYNVHYYPIELVLVFFIYWIAIAGYHKMKMIYLSPFKESSNGLSSVDAQQMLKKLENAMEQDKVYLDPSLNRDQLATHTGLNTKVISSILNQYAGKSFNDFVNYYRVEEVCENLLSSKNQHLTISGVALACGFNSQATFQRAFKNLKGMSPKEYLALELKKIG